VAFGAAESARDQYARRITYLVDAAGLVELAIDTANPAEQAAEILRHVQ